MRNLDKDRTDNLDKDRTVNLGVRSAYRAQSYVGTMQMTGTMRNQRPHRGQICVARGKQKAVGLCATPGYNAPTFPSPVGAAQSTIMQHRYAAHNVSSEPIPCAVAHGYKPLSANALSYDEKYKLNKTQIT